MINFLCTYPTYITIQLSNKCSAVTYRIAQVFLVVLISYLIYINASWNKTERGVSSVFSNVEGVDNLTDDSVNDAIDFVRPPQEKDAFFITTNVMVTEQTQSLCTDYDKDGGNNCNKKEGCEDGRKSLHGINTGECDLSKGVCKIRGWCPVENINASTTTISRLSNVDNFTVYLRNNVEFFSFKTFWYNYNFTKIHPPCFYNAVKSPMCPIFRIKNILKEVDISYASVNEKGAVIGIFIDWKCYFNWNTDPCTIKYSFKRLAKDTTGKFSGYKYKYADYHVVSNKKIRKRITAHGLRFLIMVGSIGFQFDWYTLATSIGSFLSYFSILTLVSYFIFYYVCFTERQKRLHVRDDDDDGGGDDLKREDILLKGMTSVNL